MQNFTVQSSKAAIAGQETGSGPAAVLLHAGVADRRQRALVRLACSHACQEAIRAVELVHQAAGTSANFENSPIGKARRDVVVVAQQLMVAPQFIEDAGRVLLGLDPAELIL